MQTPQQKIIEEILDDASERFPFLNSAHYKSTLPEFIKDLEQAIELLKELI